MSSPNRKDPTLDTVRWLFLYSGNQCAFPDCEHVLLNERGLFVAQTCHIAAASPEGARYDESMDEDGRRALSNLMLMCHRHHREVDDDVVTYTVQSLTDMKEDHERYWRGALADARKALPIGVNTAEFDRAVKDVITSAIEDPTARLTVKLPTTLDAWGKAAYGSSWDPSVQLEGDLDALVSALKRLPGLPIDTRRIFEIFMRRADDDLELLEADLRRSLNGVVPPRDLDEHLRILRTRRVLRSTAREVLTEHDQVEHETVLKTFSDGEANVPIWETYAHVCSQLEVDPGEAINDLDFAFLDG